eukprot:6174894-Pleurochrysis_carterae.AAC.1
MDLFLELEAARAAEVLSTPSPALHSLVIILLTLAVIILACRVWPAAYFQHELLWTVAPREVERFRIRNLILPTEALDFGAPPTSTAKQNLPAPPPPSVVQRVVQATTANLVRSSERAVAVNPHKWLFRSTSPAAFDCTPLLVFVNRTSGGRQGQTAMSQLRNLLSPHQVVDLGQGHSAEDALQSFRSVGRFRVLVCGGDGTVGWVLSLLDSASLEYTPPVAIMPLGTGNDLARALGWGGGRQPGRGMVSVLEEVDRAQVTLLDRWRVCIKDARAPRQLGQLASSRKPAPREVVMQNYLGIGVDARVALEWHRRRQSSPQRFRSRLRNKVQYARYGMRHLFCSDYAKLCSQLVIEADGQLLELPPGTEGIIVLNIASYGGGSDLWGADADWPVDDGFGNAGPSAECSSEYISPTLKRSASPVLKRGFGAGCASSGGGCGGGASALPANGSWSAAQAGRAEGRGDARGEGRFGQWSEGKGEGRGEGKGDGSRGDGAGDRRSLGSLRDPSPLCRRPPDSTLADILREGETTPTPTGDVTRSPCYDDAACTPAGMHRARNLSAAPAFSVASSRFVSRGFPNANGSLGSMGSSMRLPRTCHFVTPSMADGLLEVVAIQGVLQLGLAQMSLSGARRICQCASLSISSRVQLPVQIDGEPFELEPMFAPRSSMCLRVEHRDQAVMLCRSRVRTDGVALEALDWAMQEGIISVEQRNSVLREVARRTGSMQRKQSFSSAAGSFQSLESFFSN